MMLTQRFNKIQFLIMAILMVGLAIALYLVQTKQIFNSRANDELYNSFEVKKSKDGSDETIYCQNGTCQTDSLEVKIKIRDVNKLAQ